jgi:hypothetical protein
MFLVRPASPPAAAESRILDSHQTGLPAPAEFPAATNPVAEPEMPAASTQNVAVSVITSTEFAIATTPVLQNSTARSRSATSPATRSARTPSDPPPSLSRRLGRFITGSGKYNVKPFPTVNTSGS